MSLNEYQRQVLIATGQEAQIATFKKLPALADAILPKSPEAQGFIHEKGGIAHAAIVLGYLGQGETVAANNYLGGLRSAMAQSTRGVAKDALPMLQAFEVIGDIFAGQAVLPEGMDVAMTLEKLKQQYYVAEVGFLREQHPGVIPEIVPMPDNWPPYPPVIPEELFNMKK